MPQIDVPFLPGDKVRVKATGNEGIVLNVVVGDAVVIDCGLLGWFRADLLEAVKPVIEWRRNYMDDGWNAPGWLVGDDGTLLHRGQLVGTFPAPRAVAEETQTLWNERAASNEREGK